MAAASESHFVSRGGDKLAAALDAFAIVPAGWVCADLGCNAGGFTDCLLSRGAARVYAVDTGYGALAWKLRKDPRVVVMERTNALHATLPEPVTLVVVDVAWTRQHLILPVARGLLAPGGSIISLVKPHYEADRADLRGGVLPADRLADVLAEMRRRTSAAGVEFSQMIASPLLGRKGNHEFLALIRT